MKTHTSSRPASVAAATHRRHGRRAAALATLAAAIALAACSRDSSGPDPDPTPTVASVDVAAPSTSVEMGGLLQLTATARDAQGNVMAGRTAVWTSTNQGVATVTPAGLVNGVNVGTATINATVDGKSGGILITVTAPQAVVLSSVSPNPLVPGQSATLTGSGFSTVPTANTVTIGGTPASVSAASATALTVNVPATLCTPGGPVEVRVNVSGRISNPVQQPAQSGGTAVTAAVGRMQYLQSGFCLQFAASATNESYLIGVQNVSEAVSNLVSVKAAMVAQPAGPALAAVLETSPSLAGAAPPVLDPERARRWALHRRAEYALRLAERSTVLPSLAQAIRARAVGVADAPTAIPAVVNIGDSIAVRIADRSNLCLQYVEVRTVVKAIGTKSVWLEDVANPAGGFTATDYQNLVDQFDNKIYTTQVDYFGTPTDIDGNGRIVIVITKEINKTNILGFTTTADLRPRNASCPSSNQGELYYTRAPDPNGTVGPAYSTQAALLDAPQLLAHEGTHIAQFSIRTSQPGFNGTLPKIWELEGQATLAEEVVGHAMTNRMPGQNYGFDVAFNCVPGSSPCADAGGVAWYIGNFVDMALYYGFDPDATDPRTQPISGAPEQCSWLDIETNGNNGPCYGGREVYGVPAMLLRYVSDQYGSRFPGGEKELHKRLILGNLAGFQNLEALTGRPTDQVLAEWAASLYVDDRVAGADPRLGMTSWNLANIANRLVEPAQLWPRPHAFAPFTEEVEVRAGSTAYFLLCNPVDPDGSGPRRTTCQSGISHGAAALRLRGSGETNLPANMRVWIVRLQ